MITDLITESVKDRFWKYSGKSGPEQCWLWTGTKNRAGYGVIGIRWMPNQKVVSAHRLSYTIANGEIPDGLSILHSCDSPTCVNPAHLRIGTQADNMKDRAARGRGNAQKGEGHYKATLTTDDILAIRASDERQVDLAVRYKTSQTNISSIQLRKIWKSVP